MVISNKHGINELPHELPNDLTLRKLGKIKKTSKLHRIISQVQSSPPNSQFSRNALFHRKTRACLIYFFHDCSVKQSIRNKKESKLISNVYLRYNVHRVSFNLLSRLFLPFSISHNRSPRSISHHLGVKGKKLFSTKSGKFLQS